MCCRRSGGGEKECIPIEAEEGRRWSGEVRPPRTASAVESGGGGGGAG